MNPKDDLESVGVDAQDIEYLNRLVTEEFKRLTDDYDIRVDCQVIDVVTTQFFKLLYETTQSEKKNATEVVTKEIELLEDGNGRSDVIFASSSAYYEREDAPEVLEKLGGAIIAQNHSQSQFSE